MTLCTFIWSTIYLLHKTLVSVVSGSPLKTKGQKFVVNHGGVSWSISWSGTIDSTWRSSLKASLFKKLQSWSFKISNERPQKDQSIWTSWDWSFVPLNYPFKCSPRLCQLVENWLKYSIFCQMFDNYSILYWYLHIFINSGSFWTFKGLIWNLNTFLKV